MVNFKSLVTLGALLSAASPVLSQTVVKINALGDSITGNPVRTLSSREWTYANIYRVAGELSSGRSSKLQVSQTRTLLEH